MAHIKTLGMIPSLAKKNFSPPLSLLMILYEPLVSPMDAVLSSTQYSHLQEIIGLVEELASWLEASSHHAIVLRDRAKTYT